MNLRTNSRIPHFAPLCTCFGDFSAKTLPFGSNEPIIKAKKAVEQMSEFWMSYEMIAQRYGPGYQGYPLFGAVHLGELEAVAVCILLTLLALGVKNIYLGPTLPAFLSENVVKMLVETYDLHPTTAPEQDMDAILGRG